MGGYVDVICDNSAWINGANAVLELTHGDAELARLIDYGVGLFYDVDAARHLRLLAPQNVSNKLRIDLGQGNPLPAGGTDPALIYDGGFDGSGAAISDLILAGRSPDGAIESEVNLATGSGAGSISFGLAGVGSRIEYVGLSDASVVDLAPALDYTFIDSSGSPAGVLLGVGAADAFTALAIRSLATPASFTETRIANKSNVTIQSTNPVGYMAVVDYRQSTLPVQSLLALNLVGTSADDEVRLLRLPPGAAMVVRQGAGEDRAYVALDGTGGATATFLDGGDGIDTLTIDAEGRRLTPANFTTVSGVTTISGAPLPGASITYTGYESVTVTNLGPIVPTVFTVPIKAVQGQRLVDALVGAFTASATAKASDFGVTIAWGDGSISAGVIVQDASNPSVFYVYGTHTYYEDGPLATAVTAVSLGSNVTTFIDGVPVALITPNSPPITTAGTAFVDDAAIEAAVKAFSGYENIPIASSPTIVVATFTDPGAVDPTKPNPAADYTATIYWGDGTAGVGSLTIIRNGTSYSFIVSAAPHTYANPGSYAVTVVIRDADDSGVAAIASNVATIADAPLIATPRQPTIVPILEGYQFVDWVVGSFTDANPLATPNQYTVSIDWGDGSPASAGRVVQPGGVGTTFYIVGTHNYVNSLAAGAFPYTVGAGPVAPATLNGAYRLTMAIKDTFGSVLNLTNQIAVTDRALSVVGALDSASDSGVSKTDGVTNVAAPTFSGFASEAGASVYLYGSLNGGSAVLLGSTTADITGAWSITPGMALADGGYRIQA
ncbi:Ig-like domain-containing protein [Paludisphaera soli]|uniref:Ig-like domain-containing protein n=1 Tax=Paludisphaera soli TaxID=2712865 RepID=UPI0013EE2988|nr:Ig-like domain-containing protein [Paludisphaera soli]